jgi:RimJ/RimL family protein N-acetyltransferase
MIFGERVRLRAVEHDDLPRFVAWLNDPEVLEGLAVFLPLSQAGEERWYQNMLESPPAEHPLVIEVRREDGWMPVGNCGLHKIDPKNREAEVGIFIGEKSCWNQGYGTDAMRLMLEHAFRTLNLHRVFLRVMEPNRRAVRCYEKVGFVHEGRMRQAEYKHGEYLDVLLMSVLQQEWLEKTA